MCGEAGVPSRMNRVGSMWTGFFSEQPVTDYASAKLADAKRFGKFFHAMLDRSVYLAPSQFEAAFVSTAHDARAIDRTLSAARDALCTIGEVASIRIASSPSAGSTSSPSSARGCPQRSTDRSR
jgi:glutamate-1-semialdehyde aminotransferase